MTRRDHEDAPFAKFPPAIVSAHDRSSNHRSDVVASQLCGCFYCLERFLPAEIREWTDGGTDDQGQTAICPRCGIDSVLGDASGFELSDAFLSDMHYYWFQN